MSSNEPTRAVMATDPRPGSPPAPAASPSQISNLKSEIPSPSPTVLLAGGGSGGHIYPGLAIAERLAEISPGCRCLFACSRRSVDRRVLESAGAVFFALPAQPFSLRPVGAVRFAAGFLRSRRAAAALLRDEHVDVVVALGGFVAAPVVQAAARAGVPAIMVNLDARMGRANRWVAERCTTLLSAVPISEDGLEPRVVGMPLRRAVVAGDDAERCRGQLGLVPRRRTLLVVGGSQGATSINAFMAALIAAEPDRFGGWQVLHICGGPGDDLVAAYRRRRISAVVMPFCDRMGLAWGAADLAVSRAGAGSVAEVAANAVPTLFLPYPYHRDRHQHHNAAPLVECGGALLSDDLVDPKANARQAGAQLLELMADDERRARMRTAMLERPVEDGALAVADAVQNAFHRKR